MKDDELQAQIRAVSEGDRTAFEKIYNHLSKPMFTIILRITRDQSSTEDILQEVFVKLFQCPPVTAKKPRAYMFQMARNLAIDSTKSRQQFADLNEIENLVYSPAMDVSDKLIIEEALRALPSMECQIVSLRINAGLTFKEISEILSIPLGTALWRYRKAISQLRSYISGGVT